MTAQALIFDLSAFPGMQASGNAPEAPAGLDADRLLDEAVEHGLPCALISELPYPQAEQQLRRRFGDTAHHIFSVVLTGADFKERGHKAPYAVVLNQMGVPPDDALAVTSAPHAIAAARSARIGVKAGRRIEPIGEPMGECDGERKAVRKAVRKTVRTSAPKAAPKPRSSMRQAARPQTH